MERPQPGIGAKHFAPLVVEEDPAGQILDLERPGPVGHGGAPSVGGDQRRVGVRVHLGHVEVGERPQHFRTVEVVLVEFPAGGAARLFEEHRQVFARRALVEPQRRRHEEALPGQPGLAFGGGAGAVVVGQALLFFVVAGHIIEHDFELVRRIVAVEARHRSALFVEKDQGGGVLHAQAAGKGLFGGLAAFKVGHFAVAPDVDGDHVEMAAGLVGQAWIAEVLPDQAGAVGAAVLMKVEQHPLARGGRLGHVFAQVEKGLFEPGWLFGV